MEYLGQEISECINSLGLLIDILYKLPLKQRESYLHKIQHHKDDLLDLKQKLRLSNKNSTEVAFQAIKKTVLSLKREIEALNKANQENHQKQTQNQNRLNAQIMKSSGLVKQKEFESTKEISERVSPGALRPMKQMPAQEYESLMNDIVGKSESIESFKAELQTQECLIREKSAENTLISENLQLEKLKVLELETSMKELSLISEEKEKLKTQLQEEYQDLKDRHQECKERLNSVTIENERLRDEILKFSEQQKNYEYLAETSMMKANIVSESLAKMEAEAMNLNREYQRKQSSFLNRIKELEHLEFQVNNLRQDYESQCRQSLRKEEDLLVLEGELSKIQKDFYDLKVESQQKNIHHSDESATWRLSFEKFEQSSKDLQAEKLGLVKDVEEKSLKNQKLSEQLLEQKQINLLLVEENKKLSQCLIRQEKQFENSKSVLICDLQLKKMECDKLSIQTRKALDLSSSLQKQLKEKAEKIAELEKQLKETFYQGEEKLIRMREKDRYFEDLERAYQQIKLKQLGQRDLAKELTDKLMACEKELKDTKIRLHKAKIEAIQDLRGALF